MKRLRFLVALLLITFTGVTIAYSGWLIVNHLSIGVSWEHTGEVVFPNSVPETEVSPIEQGDKILAVNGQPLSASTSQYLESWRLGDTVELRYQHEDRILSRTYLVSTPSLNEILDYGVGIPTATIAWIVGLLLLTQEISARESQHKVWLTGAFFILASSAFAIGNITHLAAPWLYKVYSTSFWVLGGLGTLVHLDFPRPYQFPQRLGVQILLSALSLGGVAWALLAPVDVAGAINRAAHSWGFYWFATNLIIWIALLLWNWWRSPTLGERRQMGVVAVGGILALGPFLGLLVLPRLLALSAIPGAQLTLLSVSLLPISYGYAILRYRRMAQDRFMARVIVYAFTTVIVVIVFFLVMAFPGFRDIPSQYMIWIAALLGGVVAGPMMRGIERWLSWMLFGRWTQPLKVASDTMAGIDLRVERRDLSTQVREIISRQLQIHDSAVLLLNKSGRLYDPERTGQAAVAEGIPFKDGTVLWQALADNVWVCEFDEIRSKLLASPEERAVLQVPWAQAMLPLRIDKTLIGLVLVGYRTGVTFFDIDELIVLQLTAMSAAAAFDRRKLFIELEGERDQASMLSQQVITVRGEERKRIARDLHDDIIQPLIAQSYGLAVIDAPLAPELRDNTLKLVEKIREICAELRDPTLDTLGLGAAVRAAVAAFQMRTRRMADLVIDQDPNATVPDQVASAALGVLQEALTNAHKHAEAQTIQVRVNIQPDVVRLNVRDDGRGFDVLEARKRAAKTNHFGLLGADERVAAVGGAINVQSLPGQGTNVDVYLPYMSGLEGKLS